MLRAWRAVTTRGPTRIAQDGAEPPARPARRCVPVGWCAMRANELNPLVAGAVAGCPGTIDVSTTEDSPASTPAPSVEAMSALDDRTEQRPRRSGWVTAGAVILLVHGGLGITYAPVLTDGGLGPLQPVVVLIVGVSVLTIAAGFGLLRLHGWARLLAGVLAAVSLAFMYAPALLTAVAHGGWLDIAWLGVVAWLVVLFAVVRRWPADHTR